MTKGDRGERWLSNQAEDEYGVYAQRTGASGGATSRNRPDVFLSMQHQGTDVRASKVYFVEVKTRDDPYVRFKKEEVEDLVEAAHRAGGTAIFMVKPDLRSYDQVHAFTFDGLKENEKSYSVTDEQLPGKSLDELINGE